MVPLHFEINRLSGQSMRFNGNLIVLDSAFQVNYEEYFGQFVFDVDYIASHLRRPGGSSLMALSCLQPGDRGGKIGASEMIVRTVFDYNGFPAGSVINDIVLANYEVFSEGSFQGFNSIREHIFDNRAGVQSEVFSLKLAEPPVERTPFAFEVTYILNDGQEFQATTETVDLRP